MRRYSTFGGTCAYTLRLIRPSASSVLSVPDNIRVDISDMSLLSSLKRIVFSLSITSRTSSDHLLPKRATTLRIGHVSIGKFLSVVLFIS